jgi:hypothetical protein
LFFFVFFFYFSIGDIKKRTKRNELNIHPFRRAKSSCRSSQLALGINVTKENDGACRHVFRMSSFRFVASAQKGFSHFDSPLLFFFISFHVLSFFSVQKMSLDWFSLVWNLNNFFFCALLFILLSTVTFSLF